MRTIRIVASGIPGQYRAWLAWHVKESLGESEESEFKWDEGSGEPTISFSDPVQRSDIEQDIQIRVAHRFPTLRVVLAAKVQAVA